MSTPIARRVTLALATALVAGMFAGASGAQASTLYACVKSSGAAHVFSKKPKCKKGEKKLSWNSAGPAGKNGSNGSNGANGANGTDGKEGVAGQPQKAASFDHTLEAPFASNTSATLFSGSGVTVRFNCVNAVLANVANLEATGPTGAKAVSGMVAEKVNHKEAIENFQQAVYDVALTSGFSSFAALVTNGGTPKGNVAHVNATITTTGAIIVLDSFIEVKEDPEACNAMGVAYSIPD